MRGVWLISSLLQTCGVHNVLARRGSLLLHCILYTSTLLCHSTFKIRGIHKARLSIRALFSLNLYIVHSLGSLLVMLGSVLSASVPLKILTPL